MAVHALAAEDVATAFVQNWLRNRIHANRAIGRLHGLLDSLFHLERDV